MRGFARYIAAVERTDPIKYVGRVTKVLGILVESRGPRAVIGEVCQIVSPRTGTSSWAEVVGLREDAVQLMSYDALEGIEVGCPVIATGELLRVPVSDRLLGRVLDSMGRPADGKGDVASELFYPSVARPPDAMTRNRITRRVVTGVRSIDGLIPLGRGQRMGIFAGSGVGKSVLLGMLARYTHSDVTVMGLIGERGREVREFIENDLGPEGLARSVVIVSTSDTPPLSRLRGAYVATAVAEYFRDRGKDVMLLFDSVTRFARAQREIGLASRSANRPQPAATRLRSSIRFRDSWSVPVPRIKGQLPASTQSSSTATTWTSPCPTPFAASSTATSFSTGGSPSATTIRRSTCSSPYRASRGPSPAPRRGR